MPNLHSSFPHTIYSLHYRIDNLACGIYFLGRKENPQKSCSKPELHCKNFNCAKTDLFEGKLYVNLHTASNPGGETRDQITGTCGKDLPIR